jgi:hypothetical protein
MLSKQQERLLHRFLQQYYSTDPEQPEVVLRAQGQEFVLIRDAEYSILALANVSIRDPDVLTALVAELVETSPFRYAAALDAARWDKPRRRSGEEIGVFGALGLVGTAAAALYAYTNRDLIKKSLEDQAANFAVGVAKRKVREVGSAAYNTIATPVKYVSPSARQIAQGAQDVAQSVSDGATYVWDSAGKAVPGAQGAAQSVRDRAARVWDSVSPSAGKAVQGVQDVAQSAISTARNGAVYLFDKFRHTERTPN